MLCVTSAGPVLSLTLLLLIRFTPEQRTVRVWCWRYSCDSINYTFIAIIIMQSYYLRNNILFACGAGLKCSREATLTSQSNQPVRLSTIIVATEEGTHTHTHTHTQLRLLCLWHIACSVSIATKITLRSDVYVDTISRIDITTRTRELLLEEEPEKFEVRAFDDEGERDTSHPPFLPQHVHVHKCR